MSDLSLWAALIGGFIILALAGDFLVRGALALATRLGLRPFLAGILIVGFGTSAPELFVSLSAALDGSPAIALGNIVGSNIANVLLVLAVPALIVPLSTQTTGLIRALLFMLAATAGFIGLTALMPLSPLMGLGLIAVLIVYVVIAIRQARRSDAPTAEVADEAAAIERLSVWSTLCLIVVGMIGLPLGAHLMVEGGVGIAREFAISEYLIGLTLLAIGTSLPELGAAMAAALRRRADVVVGNIIGSNVFNLLGAGGLIALFGPLNVPDAFIQYDYWILGFAAILLAGFILPRSKISRLAASAMILVYLIYLYGLINGWDLLAGLGGLIG